MKDKKIIPIIMYSTKIGNVEIDKNYLDIIECNQINFDIEYRKSIDGNSLFLININKEKK